MTKPITSCANGWITCAKRDCMIGNNASVCANRPLGQLITYSLFFQPNFRPGNIFAMPDLDKEEAGNNEEENVDEKPSTSKKRRTCK